MENEEQELAITSPINQELLSEEELVKKKHPKGLYLLFFTEMWERFSYYGMRAILVLYLTKSLIEGGLAVDKQTATLIYGFFCGFVYFTPMLGGWLADKYLGQRRAITIGGITMMIGQFTLFAINTHVGLFAGLLLLIIGNGFFKPNISTIVGKLYTQNDPRKDSAFSIFYSGVNLGALIAPFIIAILTDDIFARRNGAGEVISWGYKYGFLAAGIGMFFGQILFNSLAQRFLGDIGLRPKGQEKSFLNTKKGKHEKVKKEPLTIIEKKRILVIFVFFFFAIFFWAAFEQAGSSLTLYTDQFIDRGISLPIFGHMVIPTPIFQAINPFFIVILAPIFGILWRTKFGQKLSTPSKMGMGMIILGLGFVCMLGAIAQRGGDIKDVAIKASLWWMVITYLLHTIGELCLSPVGLSVVTKLSPPKLASVLMGVWLLSSGFANIIGGFLASYVESMGAGTIFVGVACTVIFCGLIMLCLNKTLLKIMGGVR